MNQNLPIHDSSIRRSARAAIWCCVALCISIHAESPVLFSRPAGAINDFAGVLSPQARGALERVCIELLAQTGVAVVVVTTPDLKGDDIDDVAGRLYEKWGIGGRETDEGVLVIIAVADRSIRIETGYGVEGYITDAQASHIIRDSVSPHLREKRWDEGITAAVMALVELIAAEKRVPFDTITAGIDLPAIASPPVQSPAANPAAGLFFVLAILFLLCTPMGRAILPYIILAGMSSSRRPYGGGFGGGFRSGGFGGFGGGRSGGGGASGRF